MKLQNWIIKKLREQRGTSCTAAFNQVAFRFRNDDGDETTATWRQNQNVNDTIPVDTNFRIRFEIQETAGCAGNNKSWRLQYNLNSAGWINVTATSSVVRSSASPNLADAANVTNQLSAGTGTFIGLTGFDEVDGVAGGGSMDVPASGHAETEFCIQIRSADVANNDSIGLRATDSATAFAAYGSGTATVTVSKAATYTYAATGGLTNSGAAAVLKGKVYLASGGTITTGGAAELAKGKVFLASGEITTSGAAATSYTAFSGQTFEYTATGGLTTSGTSDLSKDKVFLASGEITTGGSASTLIIK